MVTGDSLTIRLDAATRNVGRATRVGAALCTVAELLLADVKAARRGRTGGAR